MFVSTYSETVVNSQLTLLESQSTFGFSGMRSLEVWSPFVQRFPTERILSGTSSWLIACEIVRFAAAALPAAMRINVEILYYSNCIVNVYQRRFAQRENAKPVHCVCLKWFVSPRFEIGRKRSLSSHCTHLHSWYSQHGILLNSRQNLYPMLFSCFFTHKGMIYCLLYSIKSRITFSIKLSPSFR